MQDTNSLQTINDLDQIIANQQQKKAAGVTGYIVWGLSIPPISTILSMYFANKKGVLYLLLPTMTIVYTILFALFSFSVIYSPQAFSNVAISKFATKVQTVSVPSWIVISTIVLTLAGSVGGWYLRGVAKKQGSLSKTMMVFLAAVLVLQFFVEFRELVFINTLISKSIGDIYPGL